jgi:hypothetical protein
MIHSDNRFAPMIGNRYIKTGLLLAAKVDVDMDNFRSYFRQSSLIAVFAYSLVVKSETSILDLEPSNLVHYSALFVDTVNTF